MAWTLNQLIKTIDQTYIPGTPGVADDPGFPGSPARTYTVEGPIPGATFVSPLEPEGWEEFEYVWVPPIVSIASGGYRRFGDVTALLKSVIYDENAEDDPYVDGDVPKLYVYQGPATWGETTVEVPARPGIPPVEGTPPTEPELIDDYNLGWNASALGPDVLAANQAIKWKLSPGSVGVVVGVSLRSGRQDHAYRGMILALMANSGVYTVLKNGVTVSTPRPFSADTEFSIVNFLGAGVFLVVDGTIVETVELSAGQNLVADCSLYSGGDVIWDVEEVNIVDVRIVSGFFSTTRSSASIGAPYIVRAVGPGTHIGAVESTTRSAAVAGSVLVDGTVLSFIEGATTSNAEADGYRTRTIGENTAAGAAGATTASSAVTEGLAPSGSANVSFEPMEGVGAGPNVYVGGTGRSGDGAVSMLPMTVDSVNGLSNPSIGIGTGIMISMTASASGLTGSVSTSCDCSMQPLLAIGSSEANYAQASNSLHPLHVFASDSELVESGFASMSFSFEIDARGREADLSTAHLIAKNLFRLSAYGGSQANMKVRFALEAEGTGASVGVFEGVIGYA